VHFYTGASGVLVAIGSGSHTDPHPGRLLRLIQPVFFRVWASL
jgi:hypothetical protein